MAKFLTTRGAALEIENVIKTAQMWIVLISPYVNMPNTLLQYLKVADRRNIKIVLVYGKKERQDDMMKQLGQLHNIQLHYLENVHAKCFFNESKMIITSLNLFDSSEQKNIEMGILIENSEDRAIYDTAVQEAQVIISSAKPVNIKGGQQEYAPRTQAMGLCIRCGTRIPLDYWQPYCLPHYKIWAKYKRPHFEENYCHMCGREGPTTKAQPLCHSCWEKLRKR